MTFKSNLYGRGQDWDDYGYYTMWYQVVLEEDIQHFFMPGWFEPMTARVQAVAKITHYKKGKDLFKQTQKIAIEQTYESWDHIKMAKDNDSADKRSVLSTGNKYRAGDHHRFEVLRLNGQGGKGKVLSGNPYTTLGTVDQTGYDDLFVDWRPDMQAMKTEDLDIGVKDSKGNIAKAGYNSWTHFFETNKNLNENNPNADVDLIRRTHGIINFEPNSENKFPYHVRDADYLNGNEAAYNDMVEKQTEKKENEHIFDGLSKPEIIEKIAREPPDPLYVRIESEPVHDGSGYYKDPKTGKVYGSEGNNASSVHQIIINLNVPNMTKYPSDSKYKDEYSDRPVFFYYTGPEKLKDFDSSKPDNHVRDSLPVIINFNADFRGIFFFPNSPVVINGNDKNFKGYVIAKEFVMLKTYEKETYSDDITRGGDFVHDEENDVYYDISTKTSAPTTMIKDDPEFTKITYTQNEQTVEKYIHISKSDLETYRLTEEEVIAVNSNDWYKADEAGTADSFAKEKGYIKVDYYSSPNKDGSTWPTKVGTGYFDPSDTKRFVYFPKDYALPTNQGGKNWSYTGANSVWRAKDEDGWLDERKEYLDRYMVNWGNDKVIIYDTADDLLTTLGGYTQISGTDYWKKNNATAYMKVNVDGDTYYLPQSVTLYNGTDINPFADGKIPVKYYEGDTEVDGYAKINDDTKKYYKMYQDGIDGKATNENPMFVDELGNVQYRHERDSSGKEIEKNTDGSVPYEKISPTIDPIDLKTLQSPDPTLLERAIEDAVTDLIANLPEEEKEDLKNKTIDEKKAYLKSKNEAEYNDKVKEYFEHDFPYLLNVKFFNKDDFNLDSSFFDNFQLVKMTEYSYLNEQGENRSINNLFTAERATNTD